MRRNDVVTSVARQNLCVSCGTCAAACPFDAIRMHRAYFSKNPEPAIDRARCTNCGLCVAACPVKRTVQTNLESTKFASICYSTNPDVFARSSSGGVVTTVLQYLFKTGRATKAIVTSMRGIEASGIVISSAEEALQCAGSKYQPVALVQLLKDILETERIAFVGLPCHLSGLTRVLPRFRFADVIMIGLFCTIGRSYRATRFVFGKEKNVDQLLYRHNGHPGDCAVIRQGTLVKVLSCEAFLQKVDYIFFVNGCQYCNDLFAVSADISVGDAWNIGNGKESVTLCWTSRGKAIIDDMMSMGDIIARKKLTADAVIESQRNGYYYKIVNYDERVNARQTGASFVLSVCSDELRRNARKFNSIFGVLIYRLFERKIVKGRNRLLEKLTRKYIR